ncbi:tyrosine-protein phosphatase non-receptor type 2 isoform X2 [Helicoverpa zea]|uniref:tyrosine-protein phosphatase non-receptor type 2 isoform X2 n=1 Tax=Helicoverpa zea TaxID=7113 RepID=UPI001F597A06|nr:tyrosine-protein phosphatase non-receptor type 2 isoform X2 [Helicoverpa zea]
MSQNNVYNNKVEEEYMEIVSKNAWALVYQKIGLQCQQFQHSWNEAKKPQNKPLNRYRDVNPFDHTRVVLKRCERDYINANYVTLDRANRRYILTQGPLAFTVGHFWLMIWEQNTKAILMLNKVIEKNEIKCHWYWPQDIGEAHKMTFNDVKLAVVLEKEEDCCYYSTRLFKLYDLESGESRDIMQFHYTTWPDFGVPTSPNAFLQFLKRVRESGVLDPTDGPPVIHCSAGIGRSGTFCLVDCCLVIAEKEGIQNLNIQETLLEMRHHRMGLIQTPDQLRFCYQAVIEGTKRLDPNYDEDELEESIYVMVGEEEAPPPPPPRAESLTRAPARPLPAIPTSESLGNLNLSAPQDSSSDDEDPPTPSTQTYTGSQLSSANHSNLNLSAQQDSSSDEDPPTPPSRTYSSSASSADDEDDEPFFSVAESHGSETTELRRRRTRELADRVSAMKRKAREAERWHALKRFKTEDDKKENCEETEEIR